MRILGRILAQVKYFMPTDWPNFTGAGRVILRGLTGWDTESPTDSRIDSWAALPALSAAEQPASDRQERSNHDTIYRRMG